MIVDANLKDDVGAAAAAQEMVDNTAAPEEEKAKNLKNAISLNLQAKAYDKAVADAKLLQATNTTDPPCST